MCRPKAYGIVCRYQYRLIGSDILDNGIGIIGIGYNSIIGIDIGIGISENLADTMNNRYP
jgi:hypothetical protein